MAEKRYSWGVGFQEGEEIGSDVVSVNFDWDSHVEAVVVRAQAAALARLRKTRDESLKAIVNEALREGLKQLETPRRKKAPFRTDSANLGRCLINLGSSLRSLRGSTC